MSGCGFVVLLSVFERFSGRNILPEIYIGILTLLICVSFYLAWRGERNSKNVANQTLSDKEKFVVNKENDLFDIPKRNWFAKKCYSIPLILLAILK